jgi:predicted HNH restriction endonuclease
MTQPDPMTGELIELAPAYVEEVKTDENACVDYVYWKDFLWSPARTWTEVRWVAFRTLMTRDAGIERFGDVFERVPMKGPKRGGSADQAKSDPWERAEVWEIWCKEHKKVYWYVEGYDETLDIKDDPLEVEGFFPCPHPMFANLTTSGLLPRPEYVLAQDLYNEVDTLETRITILSEAVKVVGVYDKAADGVRRMFQEGVENDLIPVDNWALFAEKGGIRGQTDWLPIDAVTKAIDRLTAIRDNTISLLYQITGMSDIMRGGATQGGVTATEQAIKARFASTRIQALQDEFARFATDLQRLKASIIVKHYDDATIVQMSNIDRTLDAHLAPQAIQLLRSDFAEYRIEIKSEALSMTDYAAIKQERTEAIQGLSAFIQAAAPLAEKTPGAGPVLLEIIKWGMGGFKGASQIESVLDQAIAALKQDMTMRAQQPPQPDPKQQAEQAKQKGELEKIKAQTDSELRVIAAETGSEVTKQRAQAAFNMQETQQEMRAKGIEAAVDMAKRGL